MIVFWIICAIMVAIALAFVIPPLLQSARSEPENQDKEANVAVYRDQLSELEADLKNGLISSEQYNHDRDEIERRLLEDVAVKKPVREKRALGVNQRAVVYVIALGVPVLSIALYARIGNPAAISATTSSPSATNVPVGPASEGPRSQKAIERNVAALAKRLEENPNDLQGWTMLARSYATLEKFSEASAAYARATALNPNDADLLADYAFATAMANNRSLQGEPQKILAKALAADPENPKALELAGSAAFESKNYQEAVNYWQRLLAKSPPGSELFLTLTDRIKRAKELAETSAK